ncbi:hypothetical protein NKH77_34025 [Streptomyces sp. M19]
MNHSPRTTHPPRWPHDTPSRIERRAAERALAHRIEAALALPSAQQPDWPDPARAQAVADRLTAGEPSSRPPRHTGCSTGSGPWRAARHS